MKLNMFVIGGHCQAQCAWKRPPTTRPTTFHVCKTRGCQCSFMLLMMGGVSHETRWASYKYGIIKILIRCCILLDFFYEFYYNARIHERQVPNSVWICPQKIYTCNHISCICVVLLLFVLFYVLFVCNCVLPPGDNPIAVNKYIDININMVPINDKNSQMSTFHTFI